jgi:uncharacterized protein
MNRIFKTSTGDLRWGWKTAILVIGTILFGVIIGAVLISILAVGYLSQGLDQTQAMEKANIVSGGFTAQAVLSVLQLAFMLWLVRWLITRIEKQEFDWSVLGLVNTERSKYIGQGALLAVLLSWLTIGIGLFVGTLTFLGNGFQLFAPAQVVRTLVLSLVLALASGFGEEIAFRGYLQTRIAQRYSPAAAVFIVALLFALSHPFSTGIHPLLYLATAILVGILLGTVFLQTGSLWMSIALHTIWNYIQIAIAAIRNGPDERFFGAPLFVFENGSVTTQALIEFGVILGGLRFVLWLTNLGRTELVHKGKRNVSPRL